MDTRGTLSEQYATDRNLDTRVDLYRRFLARGVTWYDWLLDRLALTPRTDVGDAGCGTGELWARALERSAGFSTLFLIDQSVGMIAACRARLGSDSRVRMMVGDISDSLPVAAFDRLVAAHVVYHLPYPRLFARSAALSLRESGALYVSLPGGEHLRELRALLRDFFRVDDGPLGFPAGHAKDPLPFLAEAFGETTEESYSATLIIDAAEALVSYVLSYPTLHRDRLSTPSALAAFREHVEWWLARTPEFHAENRLIRARAPHA